MRQGVVLWVLCGLAGCTASYPVPTENLSQDLSEASVEVVRIDTSRFEPLDPSVSYQVRRGDTLYAIAWRFGQDPETLMRRNRLASETIYPGQQILLKGPIPEPPPQAVEAPPELSATVITAPKRPPVPAPEASANSAARASAPVIASNASRPPVRPKGGEAKDPVSWQWPVAGPVLTGYSTATRLSRSLQIGGDLGDPVRASRSGRVVYAGDGLVGFGNLVILAHADQMLSAYGHQAELQVKVGDQVRQGQQLGTLGSTGTDRVKLHFEIRQGGESIDPTPLLPTRP